MSHPSSGDDEEQDWSDWDEMQDAEPTQSLFCSELLPSARQALDHDAKHYGFDLRHFRQQVWLSPVTELVHRAADGF